MGIPQTRLHAQMIKPVLKSQQQRQQQHRPWQPSLPNPWPTLMAIYVLPWSKIIMTTLAVTTLTIAYRLGDPVREAALKWSLDAARVEAEVTQDLTPVKARLEALEDDVAWLRAHVRPGEAQPQRSRAAQVAYDAAVAKRDAKAVRK